MRIVTGAALVVALGACGPEKNVERENGLVGIALGADPATVPTLAKLKDLGPDDAVWHEPNEHRYWGSAAISVKCHAWRDQIWKIDVRTGDSRALLPQVTGAYGTPSFATPWQWEGPTVRMNFRGTEYDSTATLSVVKKPLEAARAAATAAP